MSCNDHDKPQGRHMSKKRAHPDLNQGPADLQSAALTTELCTRLARNPTLALRDRSEPMAWNSADRMCPHCLVARTSPCGSDNPGSTPGVDMYGKPIAPVLPRPMSHTIPKHEHASQNAMHPERKASYDWASHTRPGVAQSYACDQRVDPFHSCRKPMFLGVWGEAPRIEKTN